MAGGSGGSPSSPPAFPIPQSASEAFNNLRMLKEKQQKAMSSGNLKMAVMIGKQALGLALQLNGPNVNNELAQLYHNLSHLHLNGETLNPEEAENYGQNAKKYSELDLKNAPDNHQALELHSVILIAEAHRRIMQGKFAQAEKPSFRALEIAEEIFGNDHPGLVKALRACAMLRERQGDRRSEAAGYLGRAYQCVFNAHGNMHPGVQQVLDEYVMLLMNTGGLEKAVMLSQEAYTSAMEQGGAEHDVTMDAASRYSNVLIKANRLDEAEELCTKVVESRKKKHGEDSLPVAQSLATLGSIREQKNIIDAETEGFLRAAYQIFNRNLGSQSPNTKSVFGLLHRVREKRKELGQTLADEDFSEDAMLQKEIGEAKNDEHKAHILMNHATNNFRQQNYKLAEPKLMEAYKLFKSQFGPNHDATKAALQNLNATRQNITIQLWNEVAQEEIAKIKARRESGDPWDTGFDEDFTILGNL